MSDRLDPDFDFFALDPLPEYGVDQKLRDAMDELAMTQQDLKGEKAENERLREALREACLHQGLPEDAPPERIAAHFRNNREFREGFRAAVEGETQPEDETLRGMHDGQGPSRRYDAVEGETQP